MTPERRSEIKKTYQSRATRRKGVQSKYAQEIVEIIEALEAFEDFQVALDEIDG